MTGNILDTIIALVFTAIEYIEMDYGIAILAGIFGAAKLIWGDFES